MSPGSGSSVDLHCSAVTRELGEPAPGSAGSMNHVVLVELPLPWPKAIEDHALLADANLGNTKVFAISGQLPVGSSHRVISYRVSETGSTTFERSERIVDTAAIATTVTSSATWPHVPVGDGETDLLICTHGSRDRCCGQYGTLLHVEILAAAPEGVRVWRSSHLGGHRFAPTTLAFPDGFCWAYVDADSVLGILDRTADPAIIASKFRGAVALNSPELQAADAAMFEATGWEWLDGNRTLRLADDSNPTTVLATSTTHSATVVVEHLEPVPVPACGEPIEAAMKASKPVRAGTPVFASNSPT